MKVSEKIYKWGEISLVYADVEGLWSFYIVPTSLLGKTTEDKLNVEYIHKNGFTHVRNDPMAQLTLLGDWTDKEFSAGIVSIDSASSYEFAFKSQREEADEIVTVFENGKGQTLEHHVRRFGGANALECWQVLINGGEEVTVESISSVHIGCLSPFWQDNPVDSIKIHRLRTNWSAEAKLETRTAAELQLEDSWSSYGYRVSHIGQNGSMPCRGYMPFTAIEDEAAGCTWAVSLEAPMSWRLDVIHHQTSISIDGGIADFETGHFRKTLKKGEIYKTYSAYITAVEGGLDLACSSLQELYDVKLKVPEIEENLPVVYNEYCCSWGNPCMETLRPIIDECARLGVKEFVVDVGWWRPDERSWYTFGDWEPSKILFPNGIKELADYVRSKGMVPGIWFEFEGVSSDSKLFAAHPDWFLTRDGVMIRHRERSLLDFRKEEVRGYLRERVIRLLKDNGFGYIKVDYNEPLGIGCDGAESYGEGMRRHIEEVKGFFGEMKEEIPDLVIEVCSSGGHRLEPGFLSIGSMASFSDAHLGLEGAMIAADLHRWMLPRQMQIWATLERGYSLGRTYYTIIKGMLGRYCLSGDLPNLSEEQREIVERSVGFYKKISGVIKRGDTVKHGQDGLTTLRHPVGTRWLIRESKDKESAVLWLFSVDSGNKAVVSDELLGKYDVADAFTSGKVIKNGTEITVENVTAEDGQQLVSAAIYLERKRG